jgi:tetratricopeptide (TPR) repeat protein
MKKSTKHKAQRSSREALIGKTRLGVCVCALCFVLCSFARADTITFTGTGIGLRGCTIQGLQGGQVQYLDPAGARQRRPIAQVEALGFDGLPELDQAEAAILTEDFAGGIRGLLKALLKAETDVQRLWIRTRLARAHDLNGEYVPAAGHLAAVFMMSDDVSWRDLRPVAQVNESSYPAAKESLDNLQAALRKVKSSELKRDVETMLKNVQPVADRLAKEWTGATIAAGSTFSGLTREEITGDSAAKPATSMPAPDQGTPPAKPSDSTAPALPAPVAAAPANPGDPRSPQAIDALLAAGQHEKAVVLCAEIEKNPGDRDLAHFLYQYGRALSLASRRKDAAVMLTRCAILYPDSPDAGPALIETAMIYRDEFRKPEVARRLLERVIADAERNQQTASAALARELLASLK